MFLLQIKDIYTYLDYMKKNNNKNFVPLDNIISKKKKKNLITNSFSKFIFDTKIRKKNLKYLCPNKRVCWQFEGIEFIEKDYLDYIDKLGANDLLIDIGASIGNFACYAAKKKIKTFAVEPDFLNFNLLSYNKIINNLESLEVFNFSITNQNKLINFIAEKTEFGSHRKFSHLTKINKNLYAYKYSSNSINLDSLIKLLNLTKSKNLNIKIDCDGSLFNIVEKSKFLRKAKSMFVEINHNVEKDVRAFKVLQKSFKVESEENVQHYKGLKNYVLRRK